jgi:hypothetical protein
MLACCGEGISCCAAPPENVRSNLVPSTALLRAALSEPPLQKQGSSAWMRTTWRCWAPGRCCVSFVPSRLRTHVIGNRRSSPDG